MAGLFASRIMRYGKKDHDKELEVIKRKRLKRRERGKERKTNKAEEKSGRKIGKKDRKYGGKDIALGDARNNCVQREVKISK